MTQLADAEDTTSNVVRTYDRLAPLYNGLDAFYEWAWKGRLRRELFRHVLPGRLLDAGVGTGANMPFYPPGVDAVGVDSSGGMLDEARRRARALGRSVTLEQMNVAHLDLADASFDTVVTTFVLLCLPERLLPLAIAELVRVCRPGGRVIVLDYHRTSVSPTRAWMWLLTPWMRWMFAGRYDVEMERHVEAAGLRIVERRTFGADAVTLIVAERI
jgi:phosphatidylethanolamine/phosphatidyl-N-methylethanolamine N-methyltransferase